MLTKQEKEWIENDEDGELLESWDGQDRDLVEHLCDELRSLYIEIQQLKIKKAVIKNKKGKVIGVQG